MSQLKFALPDRQKDIVFQVSSQEISWGDSSKRSPQEESFPEALKTQNSTQQH
jgi:hypothetical protein